MENTNSNNQIGPGQFNKVVEEKIEQAVVLKDYALENNYDVPDTTLDELGKIQENYLKVIKVDNIIGKLDEIIKETLQLIYPTNYESILIAKKSVKASFNINNFKWRLFGIAIIALIAAIYAYSSLCGCELEGNTKMVTASILTVCLGAIGSLVYIMFNLIGILNESAFNKKDTYANYLRILLGGILGWIFFFVFAQDVILNCKMDEANAVYLLVPFLAGFSTKFVVGVFNQLIKAFEIIIGIDPKDADLLARRRNKSTKNK